MMTGPEYWIHWRPETLRLRDVASCLREGSPVYFSFDTGATAYLNTTAEHADCVAAEVESFGPESRVWRVDGPGILVGDHLF